MRLKESRDNWKASNIIRKVRQLPEVRPHRSKKNTRKWCKGKVGVLHDVYLVKVYQPEFWFRKEMWCSWECKTCKKQWDTTLRRYTEIDGQDADI